VILSGEICLIYAQPSANYAELLFDREIKLKMRESQFFINIRIKKRIENLYNTNLIQYNTKFGQTAAATLRARRVANT
jgi:hypothetical protein